MPCLELSNLIWRWTTRTISHTTATVYFGYGSNLWLEQMTRRCPTSGYLGIARLRNYQWIINERGYANIVEVADTKETEEHSYKDEVWGLVYSLQPDDEDALDENEGVPIAYTKETLAVEFWPKGRKGIPPDTADKPKKVDVLVYINREQTTKDKPKHEYIYRMNQGIDNAVKEGMPQAYVDEVMRPFIPAESDEKVEAFARKQALFFEDER